MTGFEAAPAPEHGPGAQILTLRGSDGQKRGEILFRPDSAVAFDPESAHAAEAVEQFTGGLITAAEWRALTPEERAQKTREHGFVAAGGFTVTDPADPSVEATGAQADILTGRIDLAPDAPSAELYHEAAHAWLAAFRRAGKLTDADVARLREAYGPSPTDPAWFNEEKFADDIKEIGAETDYGSDHGGRFPLARRFVSAVRRFAGAARAEESRRAAASGARQALFENIVYGRAFEGVGDFAAVPAASADGKAVKDSPLAGASTAPDAAETPKPETPETRNQKPETPETRNQKPETPETRNQKPETPAWTAATPQGNIRVGGRWVLLPRDRFISDTDPRYDFSLQNRSRDAALGSSEQVASIVANFDALRLLDAPDTAAGAPVAVPVTIDGKEYYMVLSGNGRFRALDALDAAHRGDEYRNPVKAFADERGIPYDTAHMTAEARPRLVRVLTRRPVGVTLQKLAELSNQNTVLQMTPAERAYSDAALIERDGTAGLFAANKDGMPSRSGSDEFFSWFVRAAGDASLLDSRGRPTDAARARARRAMLALAVGRGRRGKETVMAFTEQAESLGLERQRDALLMSAGTLTALGESKPEYALADEISRAAADLLMLARERKGGKAVTVDAFIGQGDMLDAMPPAAAEALRLLDSARPAEGIAEAFRRYADLASKIDTATDDMFGEPPAAAADLLRKAAADTEVNAPAGPRYAIALAARRYALATGMPQEGEELTRRQLEFLFAETADAASRRELAARALAHPDDPEAWDAAFRASPDNTVSRVVHEFYMEHTGDQILNAGMHYFPRAYNGRLLRGMSIRTARDAAAILMPLRNPWQESMKAIYVERGKRRHRVIGGEICTIGLLDTSMVHPREIFKRAVQWNADGIILSHNHPSGDPAPSKEDRAVTLRLEEAGRHLGIEYIDHIITNGRSFYSLRHDRLEAFDPGAKADWEAVPGGTAPRAYGFDAVGDLVGALRQGAGNVVHAIALDAKGRVTAVRRIPFDPARLDPGDDTGDADTKQRRAAYTADLLRDIFRMAVAHPTGGVILDLAADAITPDAARALRARADDAGMMMGIRILDTIYNQDGWAYSVAARRQLLPLRAGAPASVAETRYSLDAAARRLLDMPPVARVAAGTFAKSDVDLVTQASEFLKALFPDGVDRPGLGNVRFTRGGVRSSIAHGIGRAKAAAFAAVPDIVLRGVEIDRSADWKGRGYGSAVIAAPVEIGGTEYIAEVVVREEKEGGWHFYLHEVEEKEKLRSAFKTGMDTSAPQSSRLIIAKLAAEVNRGSGEKKDGPPGIRFKLPGVTLSEAAREYLAAAQTAVDNAPTMAEKRRALDEWKAKNPEAVREIEGEQSPRVNPQQARAEGRYVSRPTDAEPDLSTADVAFYGGSRFADGFLYRGIEGEAALADIASKGQITSTSETAKRLGKNAHVGMTFLTDYPNIASSYVQRDGYVLEIRMPQDITAEGGGEIQTTRPIPADKISRIFAVGTDAEGPYSIDVTDRFTSPLTLRPDGTLAGVQEQAAPRFKLPGVKLDAEYADAVAKGDMDTAQRMVDEAAKKAGYDRETFRGDSMPDDIVVYDPKERREVGIFTTPVREIADVYANKGGRLSNASRRFYVRAPKVLDLTKDNLSTMRWVAKWAESFDEWIDRQTGEEVSAFDILQSGRMFDYEGDWSSERWMDLQATAEIEGYDAVVLPDYDSERGVFPSLVVFDSKNLKLADPATYDDNGNLIPLSRRFDDARADIRYSLQARRLDPYALPDSLAEVSAGTSVAALAQSTFKAEHARHRELRAAQEWAAARRYAGGLAADDRTRLLGNYLLAKYHGDAAAAKAVVERWAKPEEAEKIRERIGDTGLLKPIVFAPTMQREGDRFNALPAVYAQWLAQKINGVVSPGFRKVAGSGAPNTGAAVADRVNRDYAFEGGEGIGGASPVILVDDVWTSGQTLWTVYEHLKAVNPSAHVAAFATLASGRYGKNVRPTAKQLTAFWEKSNLTSKSFKERLGYGIEKLTGSEIQAYILTGGRGPDAAAAFFGGGTRAARGADAGDSRAVRLRSGSGEAGLVDAPVRYALDLTGESYSKENLIVGYMAHADLTGGPFPSRARVAALADAIGLERHRYNDLAERARELAASSVDDAIRRAAASAAPDAAAFAIGELARAAERALVRAGAAEGARLARSGERIRSLTEAGVAAAMRAVTGADYADLQTDTGIDLAASLLAADPKSFGPEEARKRDEAAGAILPDPFTGEDSERVETDEDAPELTDAQRAEIARKRRERESRVQAMLDAAAARASTNRARDEERRRRREAAALADAEDAAGGGEAGADAASGGDAPADPVADALAADTAAPIDLSDRWLAAAILRVWAFARFRRENPLRHDTRGDLTKNRVAVEFYRKTAVRQLTDLARKLLEPGAPRESIRAHIADIAPHLTANQIERRTAFIFGLINRHAIRESQRGLVRKFRAQIKRQYIKGKEFEELAVDIDRTLTGAVEEDARYVMRVCELSDRALDGETSALEKERARLEAIISERQTLTDEKGDPLAVGDDDMQLRRALRQLALLDKYGAMVDMMPGEIADLAGEALASLGREALDLAARWEEYDRLVKRIKDPIVRSVSRKPTDPKAADTVLNKAADSSLSMLRQRLDWLTRYEGDPSKREEARAAISDLMNLLAVGHTGYVTARADDRAALMKALGEIFKKPDGRPDRRAIRAYLRRLDEKIPRALAGQLTRQGNQASMTYGQMLHLLAYLDQWASYSDNIIRHDRRGQAALIRSFTYEDPKTGEVRRALTSEDTQLLEWLRRAHYAGKRDVISNVMVRLCGREVESPDPLYHPVRMLQERRASLAAAARVSSWQPLAGVFSRRRKHRLDVDESASILDMFENRSHETAVLTAFGETGLVIREVLTSRAFQDAVRRFHGEKTLSRILRQVAQSLDGGRAQGGGQSAAASLAQRVSTYMYLGFNLHSASKQTASLPVFAARMGFRKLGSILFSPIDRDAVRRLKEADEYRARYGTGPASGMSAADREAYSGYDTSPLRRFFGDWGLAPTRWADAFVSLWVGQGVYRDYLAQYLDMGMSREDAERRAISETYSLIEETQQSGRAENLPEMSREHGFLGRLMVQFATSPLQQMQYEIKEFAEWRDLVNNGGPEASIREARNKFMRAAFINHILVPGMMAALSNAFKLATGDEPDWERDGFLSELMIAAIMGQFGRVFFAGALTEQTLRVLFLRKPPYMGQLVPAEGVIRFAGNLAYPVRDIVTWDMEHFRGDIMRLLKSIALTRVPARIYERATAGE